jgi:catechol 2,3-dioxygenase-like lactoylglutathione lyase family enzyme
MDTPKGINHLAITVKNMEESLDFYTRVLGFEQVFDIDNPKVGMMKISPDSPHAKYCRL